MYGNNLNDALIKALSNGNLKEVKALIKNGADINTKWHGLDDYFS